MAKPDDGHTCIPLHDADGNLTAVVHGDPDMSDAARAALAELVEAARRRFEADDADGELSRRQAESRKRIRERNARIMGEGAGRRRAHRRALKRLAQYRREQQQRRDVTVVHDQHQEDATLGLPRGYSGTADEVASTPSRTGGSSAR